MVQLMPVSIHNQSPVGVAGCVAPLAKESPTMSSKHFVQITNLYQTLMPPLELEEEGTLGT